MLERYVFFCGDSHTVGAGDPAALGWVGRVAATALREGIPLTHYNLGVRGETSVEIAARWRAEAVARMPEEGEPAVVFAVGVNDVSLRDGRPRCAPEQSLEALEGVLAGAESLGLRRFVVGPAAIDGEAENDRIAALSSAFAELCAQRRVPFVPLVEELRTSEAWRSELAAGDGAHPGARGYEEVARLVLAGGWLEWLRAEGGDS